MIKDVMVFARVTEEEKYKFEIICNKKNDTPSRLIRNYVKSIIKNNSHLLN